MVLESCLEYLLRVLDMIGWKMRLLFRSRRRCSSQHHEKCLPGAYGFLYSSSHLPLGLLPLKSASHLEEPLRLGPFACLINLLFNEKKQSHKGNCCEVCRIKGVVLRLGRRATQSLITMDYEGYEKRLAQAFGVHGLNAVTCDALPR
jgi:hypothetical protein